MAQARPRGQRAASLLGAAAAVAVVSGPLLAHVDLVAAMVGFGLFAGGGVLGIGALVTGILAALRGGGLSTGLAAGAVVTAIFLTVAAPGRKFPPINDLTTDTVNPPEFVAAPALARNAGRDMRYAGAALAAQQQAAYTTLAPLPLKAPPDDAFRQVEAVARRMPGWEITRNDPGVRTIEGVATTRLFHFKDDFVIEVRPHGDSSLVEMRSKSRDGKGDIGANAARIQGFFAAVQSSR
ncbi:MAG: Membrane protein [Deltaproteobacteria bacterium]|nr:Membrane protein [Deltaproteobacteria bacterium]